MICKGNVTIGGFKFEKIDGKKTLQSVFILDIEKSECMEVPIADDNDIDKEKLEKELLDNYRKEVVAFIDIENDFKRPKSNYVNVRFIGLKITKSGHVCKIFP